MRAPQSRPSTRRTWIGQATAATLGLASCGLMARTAGAAMDPVPRLGPSHFKSSIAAYSYRKYLQGDSPEMNLFDFVDLAATMGLDAVEPTSYYFPPNVDRGYLVRLKRHAFRRGLDISGTAIGNDFCLPDGPARQNQIRNAKTWIENAAILGAPVIRFFAGRVPKGDEESAAVERAIAGFEEVLPYAEQYGVVLALENHGGVTAEADQMLRIVRAIDHPNFGVNLDTGNFRTDAPYGDLEKLAPYAVNVQVKIEIRRRGQDKEPADIPRLVAMLRNVQYSGYVVLEYEGAAEPREAIPGHAAELIALLD